MLLSKRMVKTAKFLVIFLIIWLISSIKLLKTEFNRDFILSCESLPVIKTPKNHKRMHAATIASVSDDHLIVAYFGGSDEGKSDVKIWLSHGFKNSDDLWVWDEPFIVADSSEITGQKKKPCYNPVLFKFDDKTMFLFYKIGKSPVKWTGYLKRSFDGGHNWTWAENLSKYGGSVGPTRCKPLRLDDNTLLCGSSVEGLINWDVRMETFNFYPKTSEISFVEISEPINTPHNIFNGKGIEKDKSSKFSLLNITGIIQPTMFFLGNGSIKTICRGKGTKYLLSSVSSDFGRTWAPIEQEVDLPNAGGDCGSGLDSLKLDNGYILVVRNDLPNGVKNGTCGDRSKLVLDLSKNNGKSWKTVLVLEATPPSQGKQNCYPSMIKADDGLIHIVYTADKTGNGNRIKHVVLDPQAFYN
ncbi:exo-alpha-sialidase [Candidatus Dependentiae bacterium]|nr:exo-alpha-sialidase [Candidatus Dependentiae bacterium]MBU4387540.1 exo-alpha-sialidase [Candidatus Dependentiae bacterium]MCG2756800.1 exo-alpha-sialidase [Candidatus Dependentiae bacterium]